MNTPPAPTDALPAGEYPAVFQDALGLEEISLVPRGANQGADVLTFKSDDAADASPVARMRALAHRAIAGLTALVEKHHIPTDESAPLLASLESAAIIGAVAKDAAPPTPPAGDLAAAVVPPAVETPPAGAAPADQSVATPPTLEGERMSASTEQKPTTPAGSDATAEAVAKMAQMETTVAEAVAKAAAAENANIILAARVEKMEAEKRDEVLSAETETLFAGLPGDRTALKSVVAKLDASDKATLGALAEFAREAAKGSNLFGAIGTVAKSHSATSTAEAQFDAKVTELRTSQNLNVAQATVKAAELYPALANAVAREARANAASHS